MKVARRRIKNRGMNSVFGTSGASLLESGFGRSVAATANFFSTPDSVTSSILGNIDIDAKIRPGSGLTWASSFGVIQKDDGAAQRSYALQILAGKLRFFYTPDGSTARLADSIVNVPFTGTQTGWIRATYDSASGQVTHYTSTDGSTWTVLGTGVVLTAGAIFDSTSTVGVGGVQGSTTWNVDTYRARVYSGFRQSAGVLAVDFNPALSYTSGGTWTSATGEVWTIGGTASVRWT